jgi:hypothetical protein
VSWPTKNAYLRGVVVFIHRESLWVSVDLQREFKEQGALLGYRHARQRQPHRQDYSELLPVVPLLL